MRHRSGTHRRNNHPPTRRLNMATVYVPRLIESAEQAEALPVGTLAINLDSQRHPRHARCRDCNGGADTRDVAADRSTVLEQHDALPGAHATGPVDAEV